MSVHSTHLTMSASTRRYTLSPTDETAMHFLDVDPALYTFEKKYTPDKWYQPCTQIYGPKSRMEQTNSTTHEASKLNDNCRGRTRPRKIRRRTKLTVQRRLDAAQLQTDVDITLYLMSLVRTRPVVCSQ